MDYALNIHARRAKRARLARRLDRKWLIITAQLSVLISVVCGAGLVFVDQPTGWFAIIPATWAIAFLAWRKGDLANDTPQNVGTSQRLEDLLEFELLSRLKTSNPSAHDLWLAASETEARYFLGNRYLIHASFFDTALDKNPGSATLIWPTASHYALDYQTKGISTMALLVALLKSVPGHENYLNSTGIDMTDVEQAIPWLRDVQEKRRIATQRKPLSRIGRDWAFGYAPLLRQIAYNISEDIEAHGFFSDTKAHDRIINLMTQNLASGNATAVLVGDNGAGKTTCVHAFAERLLEDAGLENPPPLVLAQRRRRATKTHATAPGA